MLNISVNPTRVTIGNKGFLTLCQNRIIERRLPTGAFKQQNNKGSLRTRQKWLIANSLSIRKAKAEEQFKKKKYGFSYCWIRISKTPKGTILYRFDHRITFSTEFRGFQLRGVQKRTNFWKPNLDSIRNGKPFQLNWKTQINQICGNRSLETCSQLSIALATFECSSKLSGIPEPSKVRVSLSLTAKSTDCSVFNCSKAPKQ